MNPKADATLNAVRGCCIRVTTPQRSPSLYLTHDLPFLPFPVFMSTMGKGFFGTLEVLPLRAPGEGRKSAGAALS